MNTLTVDNATVAMLRQAAEPVEIRDSDCNVIGFFAPLPPGTHPPPGRITEAELAKLDRRRAPEGPGKSTREVFEHLKTLTDNPADLADLQRHIDELAERDRPSS
jgi:hypothetical protein